MRIPGIATGSTWLRTICHRVAPSPRAAFRSELGTAVSASWALMITTGRVRRPRVMPAERIVRPLSDGAGPAVKIAPDVTGSSARTRIAKPSIP